MALADLPCVERVGEAVHPDYPEAPGVLAERLELYPAGCFVLGHKADIQGYAVSHPWLFGQPPKLDSRLERLPAEADTFYLHDIALLPGARGRRSGVAIVALLAQLAAAGGFKTMSLIAVSGSERFWRQNGFETAAGPSIRAALASYGDAAQFMVRLLA